MHRHVIQYNAIATHDVCQRLNNVDLWKLGDKIHVNGKNITLIPYKYPSAAELNAWDVVQERCF